MPIKPEFALEVFGVDPEKFENDEAFKKHVEETWTKVSEAHLNPAIARAATGKMNGVVMGKVKGAFKALEVPTDGIKFDEISPADAIELLTPAIQEQWNSKEGEFSKRLKDMESATKGKDLEGLKADYEKRLEEKDKKIGDLTGAHEKLMGDFETMKKTEQEREHKRKEEFEWEKALGEIKWKQGIGELEKTGFTTKMRSDYKVNFDENGDAYWTDREGKRIPDGTKHQAFKDGSQILKEKAKELKVDETNPQGGKPVGQRPAMQTPQQQQRTEGPLRRVAARAEA